MKVALQEFLNVNSSKSYGVYWREKNEVAINLETVSIVPETGWYVNGLLSPLKRQQIDGTTQYIEQGYLGINKPESYEIWIGDDCLRVWVEETFYFLPNHCVGNNVQAKRSHSTWGGGDRINEEVWVNGYYYWDGISRWVDYIPTDPVRLTTVTHGEKRVLFES